MEDMLGGFERAAMDGDLDFSTLGLGELLSVSD
jgi:hypothetical protein